MGRDDENASVPVYVHLQFLPYFGERFEALPAKISSLAFRLPEKFAL